VTPERPADRPPERPGNVPDAAQQGHRDVFRDDSRLAPVATLRHRKDPRNP